MMQKLGSRSRWTVGEVEEGRRVEGHGIMVGGGKKEGKLLFQNYFLDFLYAQTI